MLKFVKHHMDSIIGIEIYPLISLLIFFTFFTVLIIWVVKSDKGFISSMASMPLEDNIDKKIETPIQEEV